MAKIQNISKTPLTWDFTEFDILEKYSKSELGRLYSAFPFECMAKVVGLSEQDLGHRNIFSISAKIILMVLNTYRQLVKHLNSNIRYRIMIGPEKIQKNDIKMAHEVIMLYHLHIPLYFVEIY